MASKRPVEELTGRLEEVFAEVQADVGGPDPAEVVDDIRSGRLSREEAIEYVKRVEDEKREDLLTQMPNLRAFSEYVETLTEVLSRSRVSIPLRVDVVDVKGLKRFNEEHRPELGSDAIRTVAKELKDVYRRDSDFVARVGGDEFFAIRVDDDPDGIVRESLLEGVSQHILEGHPLEIHFVSSAWPSPEDPKATLLDVVTKTHNKLSAQKKQEG